jgi:hypothetical protein
VWGKFFFFVGSNSNALSPLHIVVFHMEQLCAEGRQQSKYSVVGSWDVGVEDRHANGSKKALDPNLHSLFLIPKQIGVTNGG